MDDIQQNLLDIIQEATHNLTDEGDGVLPENRPTLALLKKARNVVKRKNFVKEDVLKAIGDIDENAVKGADIQASLTIAKSTMTNIVNGQQTNSQKFNNITKSANIQPINNKQDELPQITKIFNNVSDKFSGVSDKFGEAVGVVSGHTNEVLGEVKGELLDPVMDMGKLVGGGFMDIFGDGEEEGDKETHGLLGSLLEKSKDFFSGFKSDMTDSITDGLKAADILDTDDESMSESFEMLVDQGEENEKDEDRRLKSKKSKDVGGIFSGWGGEMLGGLITTLIAFPKVMAGFLDNLTAGLIKINKALDFTLKLMWSPFKLIIDISKKFVGITKNLKFIGKPIQILANITKSISGITTKMVSPFTQLFKSLTGVGDTIGKAANATAKGFKSIGFLSKLGGIFKLFTQALGKVFFVITIITSLFDFVSSFIKTEGTIGDKMKAGFMSMIKGIVEIPIKIVGWLFDKVLGGFGIEIIGGSGKKMYESFMWFTEKIINFFIDLPQILWSGIKKSLDVLLFLPKLIFKGFISYWTTIFDMVKAVFDPEKSIFDVIKKAIKSFTDGIKELLIKSIPGGKYLARSFNNDETSGIQISKDTSPDMQNQADVGNAIFSAPIMATGGMIQENGLVNLHAGEVVGPLDDVRGMIQTETFNEFEQYMKTRKGIGRFDTTSIGNIQREIYQKEASKQGVVTELAKQQIAATDNNRQVLTQMIKNIKSETISGNEGDVIISNTQQGSSNNVPTDIENIGVFLVNNNWI